VVEEDLRAIFEAEHKAKEKVEAAKKEAEKILESARVESVKVKEKSKADAQAKAEKTVEDFRLKAKADVEKQLRSSRESGQISEKKLRARRKEAVELVLKAVTR